MIKLFLDDIRILKESRLINLGNYINANDWIIVRDYLDFTRLINIHFDEIEVISFDHDLGCCKNDIEYTGKTAADYLINYCLNNNKMFPDWYVHSDNIVGSQNIINIIISYLKNIENKDLSNFRNYHRGIINNKFIE